MEGREEFIENGGENFTYIPCLNADQPGMDLIKTLVDEKILAGGFNSPLKPFFVFCYSGVRAKSLIS